MKNSFILFVALTTITLLFSCKSKQITVNPGAHVTVDGTDDGLSHVEGNYSSASRVDEGILVTFESDVLFPLNSSYLTDRAKEELDKLLVVLNNDGVNTLIVKGHTDATGTEEYNQWLSERRAESVKNYLVANGFSKGGITTEGYGQSQPIAPNNTTEGRQKNRRVELVIVDRK